MAVYIINLILIVFYAVLFRKRPRIFLIIAGIQLILIAALRSGLVGIDAKTYIADFNGIKTTAWGNIPKIKYEYGFLYLVKILSSLGIGYWGYFAVATVITIVGIFRYINKYSSVIWFSVVIFIAFGFFGSSLNISRQYIAMAISLVAMDFAVDRKPVKFYICIFVATLFHQTAWVMAVFYPVYCSKIDLRQIFLFLGLFILLFALRGWIIQVLRLFARMEYESISGEGIGKLLTLLIICIGSIALYGRKWTEVNSSPGLKLYFASIELAILIQLLATSFSLFTRATDYFFLSAMLLIPNLATGQRTVENRQILNVLLFLFALIWFIFFFLLGADADGVIPYTFFWQV